MKKILTSLDVLETIGGYRFHLAKPNSDGNCPLDYLNNDYETWKGWNSYKGKKNRFPKDFIVSFAQISGNHFVFGGIWKITERHEDHYEVEPIDLHREFIGHLVVEYIESLGMATVLSENKVDNFKFSYLA